MEYIIGFWLIGVVLTSLFIIATLIHRKTWTVARLSKLEMLLMSIFTCLTWPMFLGYTIWTKWKGYK